MRELKKKKKIGTFIGGDDRWKKVGVGGDERNLGRETNIAKGGVEENYNLEKSFRVCR